MQAPFTIRPANHADIASLKSLIAALDEHHRVALPHVFREPIGPRREPSWFDAFFQATDRAILLAEDEHACTIGYVALLVRSIPATVVRDARTFVEIDQLYVDASARRLGSGAPSCKPRSGGRAIAASPLWRCPRGPSIATP